MSIVATAAMAATDAVADDVPISERGPAPKNVVVAFGFWLFLLSDIVMFSAIFAGYAVLSNQTAGGPSGAQLFDQKHVFIETACLLVSSFTCGLAMLAIEAEAAVTAYLWFAATFALGAIFLGLEISEFASMVAAGAGPSRSAFLSAFFTLVGAHGIHVTLGLAWLIVMMAQLATLGFHPMVKRRVLCFSLFWHTLDIIWVALFTIVYLGAE